ncbi:RecQ family ATP-dependent DNA helicase [Treponema sp. Marseille-Q4130]|uniref:RecQ family ATP-dependent DNA helicase n=1 Tax=Treponema sp. Marseille-Q4130 TaxID=2766702 RepID=UPI0016521FCF|nr:RecQ family ATP-dependent DNA helicase [Treponema sp. Marseille-Q4130]MBC6720831.1 ATP-dependent DNA helicase RecQ [Treponema sp. Marseille-Q4130]
MQIEKEICSDGEAGLDDEALGAAKRAFGISYLYPWQRLVIANIIDAYRSRTAANADVSNAVEKKSTANTSAGDGNASEANEDIAAKAAGSGANAGGIATHANDDGAQKSNEGSTTDAAEYGRQIVLLPTGAGKSLCFLVPALLLDGPTLIIYPLLALMADQKRRMEEGGITNVTFRGNQTAEEREENFNKIKAGAKIILANPEVLQNEELVARLSECSIAHVAIDEAHCVSEWGDSFRPSYLTLGDIIKKLGSPLVTAFTATASPQVLSRIAEVLFDGSARIVRSESDRPNIRYRVEYSCCKKHAALMLAHTEQKPMIIFCPTRVQAEDVARDLVLCYGKEAARFYHAGLEKPEKDEIEKWFYDKTDAVLCATCAYGMGVDKKDIRTIVHLDAPNTAEQYIQEAGRSGRDGKDANAILLWSPTDAERFARFPKGSREYAMKEFAETKNCRRQVLLDALGAEEAVCSGCDICDAKEAAEAKKIAFRAMLPYKKIYCLVRNRFFPAACDEDFVLRFIANHRNAYTKIELEGLLLPLLNERSQKICGLNTWEHDTVSELVFQLKKSGRICIQAFPWKGKVGIPRSGKS